MHSSITARGALCLTLVLMLFGCSSVATQQRAQQQQQQQPPPPASSSPTTQTPQEDAAADRIDRPTSEPYTGDLSIFEDAQRERNLQINRVMDILKIKEGSSVADIGAGSGWFTVRAARRAGASGRVYAVEINEDYVKYIERRAAREKLPNVRTVLGSEDDPRLPAKSVDAVLILKTYHEIAQPVRVLKRLRAAMRDGALLGIIDRDGEGDDHGLDGEQVIREAGQAGFTLVEQHDFVKPDNMDYFLVFRAKN